MKVDSKKIRSLRVERQWSQEHLAHLSGLHLRTIQRLESGTRSSFESIRSLAAVFEVPAESLLMGQSESDQHAITAVRCGFLSGLQFSGHTSRTEFWWFALAILICMAVAGLLADQFGLLIAQITALMLLIPWLAACTRRLRDAGLSPWWQMMCLVPVAGVVLLLFLLALPGQKDRVIQS